MNIAEQFSNHANVQLLLRGTPIEFYHRTDAQEPLLHIGVALSTELDQGMETTRSPERNTEHDS